MLKFKGPRNLHRVVVLNPKGGSGKSTLAFNIAGYLAGTGRRVALVDMDAQGSSSHWLKARGDKLPYIHSIPAPYESSTASGADQIVEIPRAYEFAVVDAPASVLAEDLADFTVGAHAILIPVVPSAFDINAASRLIKDLLLVARVSRTKGRVGIVANRIRVRTLSYRRLQSFLDSLSIAVVGRLRDSQNYVQAAYAGICIHEMAPSAVRSDLAEWQQIGMWIEKRLDQRLTERDWFRPRPDVLPEPIPVRPDRRVAWLPAAAVALAAVGFLFFSWQSTVSDTSSPTTDRADSMARQDAGPQAIERYAVVGAPTSDAASQDRSIADAVGSGPSIVAEQPLEVPAPGAYGAAEPESEPDARAQFRDKWQLSGVAQSEGDSIVLLSERGDNTTHRIRSGTELDGWMVKDTGPDYAVFARNGSEVRLVLRDDRSN